MKQYWPKIKTIGCWSIIIVGLLIPLLLFLNRFLIPDVSCDSLNYHLFLGFKAFNLGNNQYDFFPTGIHNFSPILETVGYLFFKILGYRLGSIFSVIFIYLSIWGIYKIFKLIKPNKKITEDVVLSFLFVSSFLSFELFLGIASYFNDVISGCIGVWVIYFLMKYIKDKKTGHLAGTIILLSILLWGKQTNIYLVATVGIFLTGYLIIQKKYKTTLLTILGIFLLPGVWYLKNYLITGNPVFPFYNEIFNSRFFETVNFVETQFGGKNIWEKIWWAVYSIFSPERLGQVHDLFNDYKINLYFLTAKILLVVLVVKKKQKSLEAMLILIFVVAFEIWSLIFGYLRYALMLEFIGGLLLMLLWVELKGKGKYLFFLPILIFLIVQNKRVVNLSLAYDISFRPGWFYNQTGYAKELVKIFINKLDIKNNEKPDIYLNCSMPGMTYDVVSPYNTLPVLNIDVQAYSQMTNNKNYKQETIKRVKEYVGNKDMVKFVTIAADYGLNTEYVSCIKNLESRGFEIDSILSTDFLGYDSQKLKVIYGQFNINDF